LELYVYVPVYILVIFFVSQINWIGLEFSCVQFKRCRAYRTDSWGPCTAQAA